MVPRLSDIVQAFPAGVVSLSEWMTREDADLAGENPSGGREAEDGRTCMKLVVSL